jgi:phosphoglycolate phosphatase
MTVICFDLEGTLLDPLGGFCRSFDFVCGNLGIQGPQPDAIAACIGLDLEPLFASLPALSEPSRRKAAVAAFWDHFGEEGAFLQRVHAGAHLLLARLKRQGHPLFLITAQPATIARQALHHFDLNLIFNEVIGPLPGERWKSARELLANLAVRGALRSGGLMIGDRANDIQGGAAHGLKTIGLTCGYGSRQELEHAKADVHLASIQDLDQWLANALTDQEIHDPFSRSE